METKMTTTTITKIQRRVLEAAARRNDYAAWPIRDGKLNTGSATRVMKELIRKGLVIEKSASGKSPVWRENGDGRPLMAIISDDGLAAIGMLPGGKAGRRSRTAGHKGSVAADRAVVAAVSHDGRQMPRPGTKLAALVALLSRDEGATIEEMATATGWQLHSVRGVMSGALVRKFGLRIASEQPDGRGRVYRLIDS
jgi:hypothetical protein